jgi:amino acid transporter
VSNQGQLGADEKRLAELGYKQELERSWSAFTNFAISFSIISILAGCFTSFGTAWFYGGPVAASWGWPIVAGFILIIGLCMAEIVSAFPTAGGIYYWASKLGGPVWGWFTGWFNLIGLIGVVASVDYACAQFLSITISLFDPSWDALNLKRVFIIYLCLLACHTLLNIFPSHILAYWNNTSAVWHIVGPAIIVLILIFVPDHHQSVSWVFTERANGSGFFGGETGGAGWLFYVLPFGALLLTQYTITGFDACAHLSEETREASIGAAKGVWKAIFYSAIGGWILLLCFLFAATNVDAINKNPFGYIVIAVFQTSLGMTAFKVVMIISTVGQFFCAGSGMTSASRMTYAFSRDGAIPGSRLWSKVTESKAPRNATMFIAFWCAVVAIPALKGNSANAPIAFFALTAITVIGLYLAYLIPIFLRWRMGDAFEAGPWTLGNKYKVLAPIAMIEVLVACVYFCLPFGPAGIPGNVDFAWDNGYVQYAPVVVGTVILLVGIWWLVSARKWFKGPVSAFDLPDVEGAVAPAAP